MALSSASRRVAKSMERAFYSIYFTGRLLASLTNNTRWAHLRKLFPHASDEQLTHFFANERLLLAHGQPHDIAQELAHVMTTHGLDCDIVPDLLPLKDVPLGMKKPQPHVQPAVHLLHGAASAAMSPLHKSVRTRVTKETGHREDQDDALTPQGRRWVGVGAIVTVTLLIISIGTALYSTYGTSTLATDGSAITSTCVVDESASWLGGRAAYTLMCSATNAQGGYRLALRCTAPDVIQANLALFDLQGKPRIPAWRPVVDGGKSYLPIRYSFSANEIRMINLSATDNPNVGALPALDPRSITALLSSSEPTFIDVFSGESAVFRLDVAKWYVELFVNSCGLMNPPS